VTPEPALVVSTAPIPPEVFAGALDGTRVVSATQENLAEAVPDAAVIIGDWSHQVKVRADIIAAATRCRLIQQPTAGYENIDVDAAARAGIPVANAGPANAVAVAEFAVMATIAALRHLREAVADAERPGWSQASWVQKDLRELSASTVGIVGLGAIGRAVAERLRAFGCQVVYTKRARLEASDEAALGVEHASLDDLLRRSDVLILTLPLTEASRGLIDRTRLELLPAGATVVNVARGGVLDYAALADLLRDGRLGGAALDVYPEEPPANVDELRALPNTLLTPHIAGVTEQSKRNILLNSIANVRRVLAGEKPLWVVNGVG